jgi:hypothetical protein
MMHITANTYRTSYYDSEPAPSIPVARHRERVDSGFRELSATTAHPVAEICS